MGEKKRRGTESVQLIDDLVIDIISRVPEKDLMRFKYVSKSWRSLINTDSYLSELRSHRTALLGRPFLIIRYLPRSNLYCNYLLELDSIEDGNPNAGEIHNPFDDGYCPFAAPPCEGPVVLQQYPSRKMAVLNPTTKKHHLVPPNPAGDKNVEFMGFGYDHVHACYKLVTKLRHDENISELELMIYNVNNGTWRKSRFDGLGNDYCFSELIGWGECVDGALYWCVETERGMEKIICFVLAEEEFHEVDPPRFDKSVTYSIVTAFDGRLCLVCRGLHDDTKEFWLMECDYRRQVGSSYSPSWIKFLLISDPEVRLTPDYSSSDLTPVCFSACRDRILFNVGFFKLFWYDVGKNKFTELKSRINEYSDPNDHTIHVTSWVPNLVGIGIP